MIDNKLNWKSHVEYIKTKLSKGLGLLSKIRHYVSKNTLKGLYYSFINSHVEYGLLNLFADDTNIYYESKSIMDLERTINKELRKLYLWLNINLLSLNIDKTNFVIFHPFNKPSKHNVTIKINNKAMARWGGGGGD